MSEDSSVHCSAFSGSVRWTRSPENRLFLTNHTKMNHPNHLLFSWKNRQIRSIEKWLIHSKGKLNVDLPYIIHVLKSFSLWWCCVKEGSTVAVSLATNVKRPLTEDGCCIIVSRPSWHANSSVSSNQRLYSVPECPRWHKQLLETSANPPHLLLPLVIKS